MKLYLDAPENFQILFQDSGSTQFDSIIDLHNRIMYYLILILVVVSWYFISTTIYKNHMPFLSHGNTIELIWTLSPAVILWLIALPALKLLYSLDEMINTEISVKCIGNQWYWTYEYNDSGLEIAYDSFIKKTEDLELGELRQLAVDNNLVLPINTSIRLLTTSTDVIHSFAIPSLGLKSDCIPGRLNANNIYITRPSIYYGQCSELCGVAHAYMPIALEAVSLSDYFAFLKTYSD